MSNAERINLLTDVEVTELYGIPQFDETERDYYFQLDNNEQNLLEKYTGIKSKLFLILQLGYFKAKKQIFKFSLENVIEDINHVIKKYYHSIDNKNTPTGHLWKEIYREQKSDILALYDYREWSDAFKEKIICQIEKLIRLFPKGNDTLRELFVFFEKEKITLPSYRTLQDFFTTAFRTERNRIAKIMRAIPDDFSKKLEEIIKNDNGLTQLNVIRLDQKDFSYTALKLEVKKVKQIEKLYQLSKTLVPSLELSNNAVRYYARLAEHYSASRLRKLQKFQQWLYILCFVFNRYEEFMDNLITGFMIYINIIVDEAKEYAKTKEIEFVKGLIQELELPIVGQFFLWFSTQEIKPTLSIEEFQQLGFDILSKEKQVAIANLMCGTGFDKQAARWDYYETQAKRIAMYFRPILLAVNFEFYKNDALIVELIKTLRDYFLSEQQISKLSQSLSPALIEKIPKRVLALLKSSTEEKEINTARFEFYVYEKMHHEIDRGRLFCNESVSYCSLEHDLVADEFVDKAHEIAEEFGYKKIPVYCNVRLEQALAELENAFIETNKNIDDDCNDGIKIETDDNGEITWKLTYDADEIEPSEFFDGLPKTDIADIVKFMGDYLKIWRLFRSQKDRYVKYKCPDPLALIACILSEAFGISVDKMAQMSNIACNHLRTIHENFVYVENLKLVNNVFSNYIHNLPVSRAWDLMENKVVSDADGQKFETSQHTIQSRYSSKYFGSYKGISIYSLTANYISVNAKIIGPNEHESHHLYDVLYNNQTTVSIDMVTGDGHSINQTSFLTMDSIEIEFIPSINNIREAAEKLYSVNEPENYTGLIKPLNRIKQDLIKSESRGIIRILLSLLLQKNTQAVIIRKLASHKRYCRLQAAVWEYNKIFKSIHVLNLINDEKKRKVIKTARNRTESYHQFQRMIRKIFSGVFKGRRIISNAISHQASRLVINCVIAYNAMILDQLYQRLCVNLGEEKAKEMLRKISPVVWQHILFTGRYHFRNQKGEIDFEKLIAFLEKKLRQSV